MRGTVAAVQATAGFPGRAGGGRVVARVMFHDHELVLDHGIPGACPPARSSAVTRWTMITALQARIRPALSSLITRPTMITGILGGGHAERSRAGTPGTCPARAACPARAVRPAGAVRPARPSRVTETTGIRAVRVPCHPPATPNWPGSSPSGGLNSSTAHPPARCWSR